ncbi:hypothetical protein [Streptomyces sp. NPDC059166]|uniref:hypothetical protein n=1 Tax=Streptomyces sp. NPDC059166 TaxID=3346752 RepID=UPI0036D0444D
MSAPIPHQGQLAHSPVVLRGDQWWLESEAGSVPASDPAFTAVLDGFAQAMAAADRAVAGLRARRSKPSAPAPEGRR